ncbi:helix-turn-helix transcriptional regulator [Actinacidiphila oryziradicis]|uniref:helix-turn-helix domain-containing protein n=1 Tax=Actinacidiphila oryziradicis TaxID=2571141 RepID=UPI0023F34067|nr:helix-turn-helix transcriptional regulator [Actinacidiphila oryziradicis]MCW2875724.1 putative DNA-binding protein [Actinacidiphila oryziradicis]
MSDARSGGAPTALRMVLGRRLQDLREKAGLSYEQVAHSLDVTHATVRRMEKAEVGLKIPYVEKLLGMYGISADEISDFLALARQANRPGWWHRYRDVLPDWFSVYVSLEGEASSIRAYEPHYVPGLLQTEDYARAVLRAGLPHAPDADIERTVGLRMERQSLLTRPDPPLLWAVMDEAVVRRPIGGPDVMRAQIGRMIECAAMPNVLLQIVPFSAGPHPAMYGPFHVLRFHIRELPDIVCAENLVGAAYFDQINDVSTFLEALDRMCAQAAPPDSTEAILDGMRPAN